MDYVGLAMGQPQPGNGLGVEPHWSFSGSVGEAAAWFRLTVHDDNA
jgi:hypothetical protein